MNLTLQEKLDQLITARLEELQHYLARRKILKGDGLNTEENMNLFIDLTEASADVAESIERELRVELARLLKEWESRQPWADGVTK